MINNIGVSIIICCYNSSTRLKQTLKHISNQKICFEACCELIIVDNASTDSTREFAISEWQALKNNHITFTVIVESNKGLSHARKAGAAKAKYEYLIFCDDDNWLSENYVQNVYSLFKKNHNVAVLGGLGIPYFEDETVKPSWFEKFEDSYAVGSTIRSDTFVDFVYGAGLAIRKSVFSKVTNTNPMLLLGRKQNRLTAGEDSELCIRVRMLNLKILFTPSLTFGHFLPTKRLNWTYLKAMHKGFARSFVIINLYQRALTTSDTKLPLFYWLKEAFYFCGIFLKYLPKQYSHGFQSIGNTNAINSLTWRTMALNYLKYNFRTIGIYKRIISIKNEKL